MSIEDLLTKARQGGMDDWRHLLVHIEKEYGRLFGKKLKDFGVQGCNLPEAIQDVLMEFTTNFFRFRGKSEGELIIFLGRICSTVARVYRRWDRTDISMQTLPVSLIPEWLCSSQNTEHRIYTQDEINKALNNLEKQEREVLILYKLNGYSYKDISKQFGFIVVCK